MCPRRSCRRTTTICLRTRGRCHRAASWSAASTRCCRRQAITPGRASGPNSGSPALPRSGTTARSGDVQNVSHSGGVGFSAALARSGRQLALNGSAAYSPSYLAESVSDGRRRALGRRAASQPELCGERCVFVYVRGKRCVVARGHDPRNTAGGWQATCSPISLAGTSTRPDRLFVRRPRSSSRDGSAAIRSASVGIDISPGTSGWSPAGRAPITASILASNIRRCFPRPGAQNSPSVSELPGPRCRCRAHRVDCGRKQVFSSCIV